MSGDVRDDLDARAMASGFLTIWLSLLMSLVQTGSSRSTYWAPRCVAVFDAAMRPVGRAPTDCGRVSEGRRNDALRPKVLTYMIRNSSCQAH